jgi:hypothetical protein
MLKTNIAGVEKVVVALISNVKDSSDTNLPYDHTILN